MRALVSLLALGCVACASEPLYSVADSHIYTPKQIAAPQGFGQGLPEISSPIRPPAVQRAEAQIFGYSEIGRQNLVEGDPTKAQENFARALDVNPFDPIALNNLAVAKAEGGQFQTALGLLDRATKLAPNNAEIAANYSRLRAYVQEYAMAGVKPLATVEASQRDAVQLSKKGLPPAPPSLWMSEPPQTLRKGKPLVQAAATAGYEVVQTPQCPLGSQRDGNFCILNDR